VLQKPHCCDTFCYRLPSAPATFGLPGVNETPRDVAFCAHTVLHDDLFEIPDATLDARFADNPLVMGQPDTRFYAGAAISVDRWVLSRAIAWMKTLPMVHRIESINVNRSGQSVGDRAFHAWATAQLISAGATICGKLCLEITETAAVTNLADAASFIENVRAAGVKVALDDFGSGVSSFGYLKNLPVDYLEIDGQFIRDLLSGSLDDVAVRCFADVARVVGVKTVSEFVEKPAVRERLREIGVDFAQGYLIHRPEPIDCLIEWQESTQAVTA
jgi:EAL domain-containing protein (putative c-di-GMP-specific phosphodiesterase class I)